VNIDEAMAKIAKEAERQGFQVGQTRQATWRFNMDGDNWFVHPRTVEDLLEILSILIAAGLDWSNWNNPDTYSRD
jgi:hypothetical protein